MFKLERSGRFFRRTCRLVAPEGIDSTGFDELARQLGVAARRARKATNVAARQVTAAERVETRWNGSETINTAQPGDWIVTALAGNGDVLRDASGASNQWVVKADRFGALYEPARISGVQEAAADGAIFAPKGAVDVLWLSGGFEIKASWGELQTAPSGYILRNGADVYGNNRETFEATYAFTDR